MSNPDHLTKAQAAAAAGVAETTIQRYKRDGKLPGARYGANNALEIPVTDLVAAGLLDPLAATGDVIEHADRRRAASDLAAARHELELARARIDALEARLADSHDEVRFLRSALTRQEVA